jgi:acylphosphatase
VESIHLEIRGRVQGVGFRWYVMEIARELGLSGWVKNRPDGIVELAAAGDSAAQTRSSSSRGPRWRAVEAVRKRG